MMIHRWRQIGVLFIVIIIMIIQNLFLVIITSPNFIEEDTQDELYKRYRNDWHIQINEYCNSYKNKYNIKYKEIVDNNNLLPFGLFNSLIDTAWPMQSHDTYHTGRSQYSTENNPGTEKWRFKTLFDLAGAIEASAVIDNNGIIYVGSIGGDCTLYALYPNGTMKWNYYSHGLIWSSPAIADDRSIYFGDWDSKFYAIYSNGTRKWIFNVGEPIGTSPNIAENGTIYFGTMGGYFYAVNPNGIEQWHLYLGGSLISSPAIGQDGTIYIGTTSNYLYAVNPNGTLKWQFGADQFKGNPSIANDGTIYACCFNGYLYAFYPNGTVKWQASTGSSVAGAGVAIAQDGTIYVGTEKLRAFYPDGSLKWSLDVIGDIYGTVPAVSADGTIYVSAGINLVAVNPDGTIKWQKQICNMWTKSSPCIGEDGTIYVGSSWTDPNYINQPGYLHAFGDAPLSVDAGGPYNGNALDPISFISTTFGGALPYTYLWEFGDGNTSNLEHPIHTYARPGEYIATLILIDGEGNSSSDTANVSVGTSRPIVRILRPENALYLFNIKLIKISEPIIIGRVRITVEAYQEDVGIDHVSFYIDSTYKYSDYEPPYEWIWNERIFFFHDISVWAESKDGKSSEAGISVLKIF